MLANSTSNFFRTAAATLAALSVTAIAAPAFAGNATSVSVAIDRADLESEAGLERVYYKLQRAANEACFLDSGPMPISQKVKAERCADGLMTNFLGQIDNDRLVAFHSEQLTKLG